MQRRVEVAVRVRPNTENNLPSCVSVNKKRGVITVSDEISAKLSTGGRRYKQDFLFEEDVTNKDIFEQLVLAKMSTATKDSPDTLCFLAYGHTSSGKTHSIAGSEGEAGILTLCVEELLRREGVVEVTMLEVYMDSVYDLLSQGESRRIRRRATGSGGMALLVENLTTCTLTTVDQWNKVSSYGMHSRRTAATDRNSRSSRSHAIFTIKSHGVRLCLVDLAGSERQTVFSPQLNKESISINKSLSRLSTVLEALSLQRVNEDGSRSYVNFRDTTLTVLLQRYLNGASLTTFLACVHPSQAFYQETLSTLRYTQRLKKIKTSFVKPEDNDISALKATEHQELLEELDRLRRHVEENRNESKDLAAIQQQRIQELERSLEKQKSANRASLKDASAVRVPHRARDTKRIAGWLLSRVLGNMPQINVGYDEYFDALFPPNIQVIGYVSTMACLPPREEGDSKLAFLDVGDLAIGLSMVDAGIPPFVRLHQATCPSPQDWEAHEFDEEGHLVYVLAFFEADSSVMETMDADSSKGECFDCCKAYVASEPLLPIATVLCVPEDTPDEVKEKVLQRLVSLQGEQEEALDRQGSRDQSLTGPEESQVPVDKLLDESLVLQHGREEGNSDSSSLSREVARQGQDTSHLVTPYRDDSDSDSSELQEERERDPRSGVARTLEVDPDTSSSEEEEEVKEVEPAAAEPAVPTPPAPTPEAKSPASPTPEKKMPPPREESVEDGTGVIHEPKITIVRPPAPLPVKAPPSKGKPLEAPDINAHRKSKKKGNGDDGKLAKHSGCGNCTIL